MSLGVAHRPVHRPDAGSRAVKALGACDQLEQLTPTLDVALVILVLESAAEMLLGPLAPRSYGLVPRRRLGEARIFVIPGPTAASAIEIDAIKKLKRSVRTAS